MVDTVKLKAANARRWAAAKLTRGPEFIPVARRLVANKARFQAMEARTGVPWFVIAVIKERESGPDPQWLKSIAQGQAWNRRSTIVPIGRGPFKSWEEAAYDALVNCGPYASRNKDWTIGGILTLLEGYNGYGYASRGLPSPYIWSGTDQYKSGKYVADHKFDPNVVDKQLGCAGVLLAMQQLDATIKFEAPKSAAAPAKEAAKDAGKQGVVAMIIAAIVAAMLWLVQHPALAIGGTVAVVAIGVFAWRWWRSSTAVPESYHDRLLTNDTAAKGLPTPAEVWKTPAARSPAKKRRAPSKPAAKPRAKKKPSKRKAA